MNGKDEICRVGIVVPTCNPSTWEIEAGALWRVWVQSGLHRSCFQKRKENVVYVGKQ